MSVATISPKVIALHRLAIEVPCTASWAAMQGDDRVRHCGDCNKNVFNLSAMPEAAAALLLAENDGSLCVRFYQRQDGTVMTSDCSTSVQAMTRRTLRRLPGAAGVALLAMAASSGAHAGSPAPPEAPETVQPVLMMGAPPAPVAQPAAAAVKPPPRQFVMGKPQAGSAPVAQPAPVQEPAGKP